VSLLAASGSVGGLLRGSGNRAEALAASALSVWLVGLPLSYLLCYTARPRLRLLGLWLGALAGAGLYCLLLGYMCRELSWERVLPVWLWRQRRLSERLQRGRAGAAAAVGAGAAAAAVPGASHLGSLSLDELWAVFSEERALQEVEVEEFGL
jgi:hypothetical protein